MSEQNRQIRTTLVALTAIILIGTFGFMLLEDMSFADALYLTIITMATVGYGDLSPQTPEGRMFTIIMLGVGIGIFAYAAQALISILISQPLQEARTHRRILKHIKALNDHYIVCGQGEIVDKAIRYLVAGAQRRRDTLYESELEQITTYLNHLFGKKHLRALHAFFFQSARIFLKRVRNYQTLLDFLVVVTHDKAYADDLNRRGLSALYADPTREASLREAGIERANTLIVLLEDDTSGLLVVLTARNLAPNLFITATIHDTDLSRRMVRAGANILITPNDVASQFLNNATMRPAVYDFLTSVLMDTPAYRWFIELRLQANSPWLGKTLASIEAVRRYNLHVIGLRRADQSFIYAPELDLTLEEEDVLLGLADIRAMHRLTMESAGITRRVTANWQSLPALPSKATNQASHEDDSESRLKAMNKHFIICGISPITQEALNKLQPSRPFVIIAQHAHDAEALRQRGFCVVHGDPSSEEVLRHAGIQHAQGVMIGLETSASAILTTLNCRALNKHVLITAYALNDDMIEKFHYAGADRIISPFKIIGQFVLLATTRPDVVEFISHILYNPHSGIETIELYMENTSPWIGRSIGDLNLKPNYEAGIIGIRHADGHSFTYAPDAKRSIERYEVLIIVVPMAQSDALRADAHGDASRRPTTLRKIDVSMSGNWSVSDLRRMAEDGRPRPS